FQARARAAVYREPGASHAGGALEVQDAECLPQIPMRLRAERETRRRSPTTNLLVLRRIIAGWNGGVRNIGDTQGQVRESFFNRPQVLFPFSQLRDSRSCPRCIFALFDVVEPLLNH